MMNDPVHGGAVTTLPLKMQIVMQDFEPQPRIHRTGGALGGPLRRFLERWFHASTNNRLHQLDSGEYGLKLVAGNLRCPLG
jgi:hypothetical protein